MITYQILYWHDIPLQVRVRDGRKRLSKPLTDRFSEAVDNAAMRAGQAKSEDYMDGYHWSEPQEGEGSPQDVAEAVVAELEAQYPEIDWQQTAANLRAKGDE